MDEKKVENVINKSNLVTNIIYFGVMVLFIVLRILTSVFAENIGAVDSYLISIFTQVGLLFLIPFLIFKFSMRAKTHDVFENFRFNKISLKAVLVAVGLGAIVFFLNVYVSNFFNSIIQLFGYKPAVSSSSLPAEWWVLVLNLLCTAILPAICEEFLHRGMLMSGNSCFGVKKSILISGVLFGLLHLNIEQFFYATIIGLFLGYLCWSTNSIYPSMIIHFMNNALSVFLSFARAKGWAVGNLFGYISEFLTRNAVLGFVMFVLLLILLVMLAIEATKFLIKDSFVTEFIAQKKKYASFFLRKSYFDEIENIKQSSTQSKGSEKRVVYVNLNEFLGYIGNNTSAFLAELEQIQKKIKVPLLSKIFLWGAIALGVIVTVMTFIWGLL